LLDQGVQEQMTHVNKKNMNDSLWIMKNSAEWS
jgi:hypothetical protein